VKNNMEDFDSLNEKQLESLERGLSDLKHNRIITSNEFWKGLLSKKEQQTLYSEIEPLIIKWNIDGTKTAGSLTRDIMKLLNVTLKNKAKETAEYKKIFSEIQPNRLISTEYGSGIIDSQTGEVTITPYPKVKDIESHEN